LFFPRRDGKSFAELLWDGKKNNDRERNKHYNFTHSDYYASPPLRKNNNASSIKEEGKKPERHSIWASVLKKMYSISWWLLGKLVTTATMRTRTCRTGIKWAQSPGDSFFSLCCNAELEMF